MKSRIFATILIAISTTYLYSCTARTENPTEDVARQEEVKLIGSSSTYPALKGLAKAYQEESKTAEVTFLPKSQSESAIVAVKKGIVDLGSVSKKLEQEEESEAIKYQELAKDALIVATHPSVEGVTDLETEELKGIYSGEITNWQEVGGPDQEIIVVDRPEDESGKRLLREYYLGQELENAPEAVIMRHEGELITAVKDTPYSIGAFSLANAITNDLPVNRLSLNGVEPTADNVEAGEYEMVRHIGLVYNSEPSSETQNFLDFMFSEAGAEELRQKGFIPSPAP